jgi:hypothetical protein
MTRKRAKRAAHEKKDGFTCLATYINAPHALMMLLTVKLFKFGRRGKKGISGRRNAHFRGG